MNRSVLARQMFAQGGAAFPDLSGDGKITQKDILMGRGVPMQEGGEVDNAAGELEAMRAQADAMGISLEELINMQIRILNENRPAQMKNPDMENYIDESGELFYDPASGAASRRQMFDEAAAIANKYQQPVGMAMGGDPAMAQGVGSMMQAPPMPAEAPMGEQAIGPQVLEGLLGEASQSIGNLDEAEDYATVMNSIRGDDASIEERYAELADVVGPEDAQQTPESVLTLVQPAMAMAAVDQGIGGLAAEEMTEPVQGAMAQGIMSTMAPPPPPAAPPMAPPMMGGPPPVNFNQGGLVRRGDNQPVKMMAEGGDPLQTAYQARLPLYQSIIGDPTAGLEEQKELTQAQMLFDVANTALAFAAPLQGEQAGLSAAERLAMAAQQTKLLPTIGARAQQQLDLKKAAEAKDQQLKLGALSAAEADVTAQAKAKAELDRLNVQGAQKIAQIKTQSRLDLGVKTKVEQLKQEGRLDIKNLEGYQNMSLEELRQAGAISLEDFRQANREIQEGVLQKNRVAIEDLKATGRESDRNDAFELEQKNIILRANIELGRMQVASEYELEKMEIGQDYAAELQNSRLAVQESIASNRLDFDQAKDKLDQARADKELGIKKENLELKQAAEERITVFEQQTMDLKEREVVLKEAESRLGKLNVEGKNKAQQILARPTLLEGYANGTLSKSETLAVNSAIDQLSTRETVFDSQGNKSKTGGAIPEAARKAVIARNKLSNAKDLLMPRDVSRITAGPLEDKPIVSKIMSEVPNASLAFGSESAAKLAANTFIEAVTFGLADAPFVPTDEAFTAVETLNTKTLTHFQKIAELRDSVKLMDRLDKLTANPGEFFTGDTRAKNKTKDVLNVIDELLDELKTKYSQYSKNEAEYNDAKVNERRALQLRAGFEVIDNAYARVGSGGTAVTSEIEAEQDSILQNIFGKNKKVKE